MDEAGQRDGKGFPLPASKEQGQRQRAVFSLLSNITREFYFAVIASLCTDVKINAGT